MVENNQIILNMYQSDYIPRGSSVLVGRLAPCIGVIIYNPPTKEAYAGHYHISLRRCNNGGLEKLIDMAVEKFGDMTETEVFVSGGRIRKGIQKTVMSNREEVTRILGKYEFKKFNMHIRWTPEDERGVDMILYTETGEAGLYRGGIKFMDLRNLSG